MGLPVIHTIIYSGGMDSYTLLHYVLGDRVEKGDEVYALSFDYGQRHKRELICAWTECQEYKVPHTIINLTSVTGLLLGSALTDPTVPLPEGHYAEESMRLTVVPGRNTMMLSMALAFTEAKVMVKERATGARGGAYIYYGAHSGDHHIYPDCRPTYIAAMQATIREATDGRVLLQAPFGKTDKTGILKIGRDRGLNYRNTWTCYAGDEKPCGKCGSCVERAEAFSQMGMVDPTL
jgi:7-cyano-7-deazaguanine synthase